MIRVLLVDDHPVVREGVRTALNADGRFRIVAEIGDGLAVERAVETLRPDVVILDVMLPGLNGIEVCRTLCAAAPAVRVLMLSMHANVAYVVEALKAGAVGYALKDVAGPELVRAAHAVSQGKRYLSAPFSDQVVNAYAAAAAAVADPYDNLTARERQVFQLAAEGLSNIDIGRRLHISPRTVEVHRARVLAKLKIAPGDLVKQAIRRGIVTVD